MALRAGQPVGQMWADAARGRGCLHRGLDWPRGPGRSCLGRMRGEGTRPAAVGRPHGGHPAATGALLAAEAPVRTVEEELRFEKDGLCPGLCRLPGWQTWWESSA